MRLLVALFGWFALGSMAVGTVDGSDWREWFSKPRPEALAQSPDDEIPDQPGAVRRPAPSANSGPNMLEKFNSGTKKFFSRTRHALTPKKKQAVKAAPVKDRPFSGWMPNASRSRSSKSKPSAGFSSWFKPEEPAPSSTLEDFFSKPRP